MRGNIPSAPAGQAGTNLDIPPFLDRRVDAEKWRTADVTPIPAVIKSHTVFEAVRREITEATTVEQMLRILVGVTGLAAAARRATDGAAAAEAAVLRLEAERKLGQIMQAQKATVGFNRGGRPKTGFSENPVSKLTLGEAGIDKNTAHRARRAAAISEAEFKRVIEAEREAVRTTKKKPRSKKKKKDQKPVKQAAACIEPAILKEAAEPIPPFDDPAVSAERMKGVHAAAEAEAIWGAACYRNGHLDRRLEQFAIAIDTCCWAAGLVGDDGDDADYKFRFIPPHLTIEMIGSARAQIRKAIDGLHRLDAKLATYTAAAVEVEEVAA